MNQIIFEKEYKVGIPDNFEHNLDFYKQLLERFFLEVNDNRALNFIREGLAKITIKNIQEEDEPNTWEKNYNRLAEQYQENKEWTPEKDAHPCIYSSFNMSIVQIGGKEFADNLLTIQGKYDRGVCPVYILHQGREILVPEIKGLSFRRRKKKGK